jgi:hypothetical protein
MRKGPGAPSLSCTGPVCGGDGDGTGNASCITLLNRPYFGRLPFACAKPIGIVNLVEKSLLHVVRTRWSVLVGDDSDLISRTFIKKSKRELMLDQARCRGQDDAQPRAEEPVMSRYRSAEALSLRSDAVSVGQRQKLVGWDHAWVGGQMQSVCELMSGCDPIADVRSTASAFSCD